MFQNLKIDIIYYNTSTDFEMEFNLNGCCRMRLLADKVSDRRNFVHMLARDVARSRVIFVIGKLFGESGMLELTAKAIGKNLAVIENSAYGIESKDQIRVIEGSVPLVTTEGYFGGCIIESGPQTMILLTENKSIRKNIMANLIHPYIEQMGAEQLRKKADTAKLPAQPEVAPDDTDTFSEGEPIPEPDTVPATEETAVCEEESPDLSVEELRSEVEVSGNMHYTEYVIREENDRADEEQTLPPADDELFSLMSFGSSDDEEDERAAEPYTVESGNFVFDDEESIRSVHTQKRWNVLNNSILLLTIFLILVLLVLFFCAFFIPVASGSSPAAFLDQIIEALFGNAG